jgi:hypothetical protein
MNVDLTDSDWWPPQGSGSRIDIPCLPTAMPTC